MSLYSTLLENIQLEINGDSNYQLPLLLKTKQSLLNEM